MLKISWLNCGVGLLAGMTLAAGVVNAEQMIFVAPHTGETVVFDSENPPDEFRQRDTPTKQLKGGPFTWNVTYQDVISNNNIGFDDSTHGATRRTTAEAVLNFIASVLNESTGAVVDVHFAASQMDGSGPLATAGPFFSSSNGFDNGTAFNHITTGVDPSGTVVDITSTVDFGYTYQNDHTLAPSGSQNDLFSVLLHEMTHGLGIASTSLANGNSQISGGNPGRYTVWDQLMRSGTDVIWNATTTALEPGITSATFTSENLFFSGPTAAAAHGSNPPVFAPNPFASGSSLSHFETFSVDSVMEPVIITGVAERVYSDVDLGALFDIGYTNVSVTPTVFFDASTATVSEAAGSVTVNLLVTVDPGGTETVTVATADGTAAAGVDYTTVNQSFNVGPGTTPVPVEIDVTDNMAEDGSRTFTVTVSNPSAGLAVGTPATVTVTITDNEAPNPNAMVTGVSGVGFIEVGDVLQLSVQFSGLVGTPTFQWEKDGADVVDDVRISGSNAQGLTIDPVQMSDSGIYELTGTDESKGSFSSGPLAVTVVPAGSLPAAGMAALGMLAGLLAASGVVAARRRRH